MFLIKDRCEGAAPRAGFAFGAARRKFAARGVRARTRAPLPSLHGPLLRCRCKLTSHACPGLLAHALRRRHAYCTCRYTASQRGATQLCLRYIVCVYKIWNPQHPQPLSGQGRPSWRRGGATPPPVWHDAAALEQHARGARPCTYFKCAEPLGRAAASLQAGSGARRIEEALHGSRERSVAAPCV
jgi:hypothetical protein